MHQGGGTQRLAAFMSLAAGDPPQLVVNEIEQPAERRAVAVAGCGEELRDVSGSFWSLGQPGTLHNWQWEGGYLRVSEARFLIQECGRWHEVVAAWRLGDRLGWESEDLPRHPIEMAHCIPGTFALHLALAGWPLVRSEEAWERRYHWSDAGEPEGLAYKIEIFEAVYRERGFNVRTPRIPGSWYRDLDEIEAEDSEEP